MKLLSKILGASVILTVAVGSFGNVSAFAADSDSITVGTPYDATAGEYTSDLTKGHVIAVPIDIDTTTGTIGDYTLQVSYDNTVLSVGADTGVNSMSDAIYGNLTSFTASYTYDATNTDILYVIDAMGTAGRGGSFTAYDTITYNPNNTVNSVIAIWAYGGSAALNANAPELYLVFTVLNDYETLNTAVFSITDGTCGLGDSYSGKGHTSSVDNSIAKSNACDGAFKVVVDSSALTTGWVQGVTAVIGSETCPLEYYVTEDGVEYSFPARVHFNTSTTKSDTLTAEIYATITPDEKGEGEAKTEKWGEITFKMDGTATSYTSAYDSTASE